MKKHYLSLSMLLIAGLSNAQQYINNQNATPISALSAEVAPSINHKDLDAEKALWSINLLADISTSSNSVGFAGVTFLNNQFWLSKWNSDTLARFSNTGAFIDKFVIPGVTGIRCITTDGTSLYMGANTSTIYVVNPLTLASTGTITTTNAVRFLTYDPTLNSNAGGFWMGNFATNIESISMNGTVLSSIPSATHTLTGMYGAAIDRVSPGGPYLWVHDQGGTNSDRFIALQLPAGTPTTYIHDVFADLSPLGVTSTLAGGAFLSSDLIPGEVSLIGVTQSTAVNSIIAYELSFSTASLNESQNESFDIYPNPASEAVTIKTPLSKGTTVQILDMTGAILTQQTVEVSTSEMTLTTSQLAAGVYILELIQGDLKTSKRIIKQ